MRNCYSIDSCLCEFRKGWWPIWLVNGFLEAGVKRHPDGPFCVGHGLRFGGVANRPKAVIHISKIPAPKLKLVDNSELWKPTTVRRAKAVTGEMASSASDGLTADSRWLPPERQQVVRRLKVKTVLDL